MKICPQCGSTEFKIQMREVAAFLGVNREVQVSGMMSVEACSKRGCGYVNVPWDFKWGDPLSITVKRPRPPGAPPPTKKPSKKGKKKPKRKKGKR